MSASLRWQQTWQQSSFVWLEGWADAFPLGSVDLAATGHASVAGDPLSLITFDIGSGEMAMTGHTVTVTPGLDFLLPDIHAVSGSLLSTGHASITGTFDFEEPFFVDPPLVLDAGAHAAMTGTVSYMVVKTIGSGAMNATGHVGFGVTQFGYLIDIIKPLLSVSLSPVAHATVVGDTGFITYKQIGSGLMNTFGRATLDQTGLAPVVPEPNVFALGAVDLLTLGGTVISGDVVSTFYPPHNLGSIELAATGRTTVATPRIFSGGLLQLLSVTLPATGRLATVFSAFSYPGAAEIPEMEIVAVYEGVELTGTTADLEGDDVVIE